jgi:hypothetical protein
MAVYYVAGGKPAGTAGAIEKVIDDTGTVWFDNLATKAVKKAGWSTLPHVQKFKTITEGTGQHSGER